jgi:hypothetical protein
MSQCLNTKQGEYNWLRCCRQFGHPGECNWVVAEIVATPKNPAKTTEQIVQEYAAAKADSCVKSLMLSSPLAEKTRQLLYVTISASYRAGMGHGAGMERAAMKKKARLKRLGEL